MTSEALALAGIMFLSPFEPKETAAVLAAVPLPIPFEVSIKTRYRGKALWESTRFFMLLAEGRWRNWTKEEWVYAMTLRLDGQHIATLEHAHRAGELMEGFGRYLNWSATEIRDGKLAAGIHDVGKLFMPASILEKKGSLTHEEMDIMRRHVKWSERCLRFIPGFRRLVHIVGNHHEKWDGSGYPLGLHANEISKVTHALAIIDAWDAITQARYYSRAKSTAWAAWELKRCAGTQFDPELVDKFLKFIGINYVHVFSEPSMYDETPPDVKLDIRPIPIKNENGWTGPRILFVGGPASNISDMRRNGWRAFGSLSSDTYALTPWHIVAEPYRLGFRDESFGRLVWLYPNHMVGLVGRHFLNEAVRLIYPNGFLVFNEHHYEFWADLLHSWGWMRHPQKWGNMSVWQKGTYSYRSSWKATSNLFLTSA